LLCLVTPVPLPPAEPSVGGVLSALPQLRDLSCRRQPACLAAKLECHKRGRAPAQAVRIREAGSLPLGFVSLLSLLLYFFDGTWKACNPMEGEASPVPRKIACRETPPSRQ